MNNQNTNNLINSLFDVINEYRGIIHSIHSSNFREGNPNINFSQIQESQLNDFYRKLQIFRNQLNKIRNNPILIKGFTDTHYSLLNNIKYFLLGLNKRQSRSFHDIIFTNILKMNNRSPRNMTRIFTEFIKGITYFKNEDENKNHIPIYHRAASCGTSSNHFRNQYLKCYSTNLPENIEIKKKHIFKCYLERMIYDHIYKYLTFNYQPGAVYVPLEQNEGHRFQLSERAHNFNSCFLGMKIDINILYDNFFPIILEIEYKIDDNIIKKETYEKFLEIQNNLYGGISYQNYVYYKCEENDNIIYKTQTFEHPFT